MNPFAYCGDFLSSPSGKKEFEAEVNRFISLYPGSVVKEGDKFNFEEFYAAFALK